MKKIILCWIILKTIILQSQTPQINLPKTYISDLKKQELFKTDSSNLYVHDNDASTLFYYALIPKKPIKALLVLFPGTWELTEEVLNNNNKLVSDAHDSDIMTIIPSINYNLCMDEAATKFVDAVINDVIEKYHAPGTKIIMGGFSLGGMNAIRYTEAAYEGANKTKFKPIAVYGVDPPLDLVNLYYTFKRTVQKNVSRTAVGEANSYLTRMETNFGGDPEKNSEKYRYYSMYSRDLPEGGNTKYLKKIPVRIYSDPDIDWHLKNRNSDLYDMNALDQTAMINTLHELGNDKAEYVNALGKGFRPNGMRHPHSWSIADPKDCLDWILRCIN